MRDGLVGNGCQNKQQQELRVKVMAAAATAMNKREVMA
jgi:hypothetical protein